MKILALALLLFSFLNYSEVGIRNTSLEIMNLPGIKERRGSFFDDIGNGICSEKIEVLTKSDEVSINSIVITNTGEILDYSLYPISTTRNNQTKVNTIKRSSDYDGNGIKLYLESPFEDGSYEFGSNKSLTFFIQFWHSNLSYGSLPTEVWTTKGTLIISDKGTKFDFKCEGVLSTNPNTNLLFTGNITI